MDITMKADVPSGVKFDWNHSKAPPRLVLIAESEDFDRNTIKNWKDEGFQIMYIPFSGGKKELVTHMHTISDPLELGETYAIVAYGDAAEVVLDICMKPTPKLCAVVAYYPTIVPNTNTMFPPNTQFVIHIAGDQPLKPKQPSYSYPHAKTGFAESDLEEYDKVSTSLAWSRSLAAVRKGFGIEVDLEKVWEDHLDLEFKTKDADRTMSTMVPQPYVNHIPTMTGGIGYKDLHRFYRDFFIPNNPPSMKMQLISRTIGTDRVVDEMHVSFTHTQEIPWMLPGVKPTNKDVEVALVSVVCIRGKKLYHEHIYWDQATVLVQIGLLDPKLVPDKKLAKRLPVVGAEGARKVLDEQQGKSNELIDEW